MDLLQAFKKKRNAQENKIALEAQKLINLYRHLSVFRPSFVNEFNKMLLSSTKEVQMMMPSIVGGPAVRQYLEYLQGELHQTTTEDVSEQMPAMPKGYLPNPEEDVLFQDEKESITQNALLSALNTFEDSNKTQAAFLEQALKEFQKSITQASKNESISHPETLQKIQQETLEKTLEKMIYLQTNLFSKMVTELTKTFKETGGYKENTSLRTVPHHVEYRAAQPTPKAKESVVKPNTGSVSHTPSFSLKRAPAFVPPADENVEILSEIDLPQSK